MTAPTSENILRYIQNAYQTMDNLHLSMSMLAVIAVIVVLAFLFAVREVAAWFLKVDNLKSDIRSLEDSISRLEVEVRALHQNAKGAEAAPLSDDFHNARTRPEQFPIQH